SRHSATISVVVPVLNEEKRLAGLLSFLFESERECEVIVSDGGSTDRTVEIARAYGATVVQAEVGRGIQQAAGAKQASGDVLLFLHADSQPHTRCLDEIKTVLGQQPEIVGGNFRVEYDDSRLFSRYVEILCAGLRMLGLYYGDSGIFVRRKVYEAIGGFKSMSVMEDVDFVLRLERYGKTCCISKAPLRTSTRRFTRSSSLRLLSLWVRMHAFYALGASDEYLAALYDSKSTESNSG
ncbi:MAG: TIGR04283 family arsenosugar biosynthesis glycosyltransferase, partial [Candidatus Obscuribacterales bacterium]|nr:TIGR04283 family arsenosugar biosynthesis glycosyltransferase [Candidatus Obscuribacterales bacterium]